MHRMVSEAEDCNTSCLQIQVDDMACQLEPGGFVISCTQPTMASANLASSSSYQTQNLAANSTTVSFTFNTPVKLDQSNYLIWRSQVLASIRGNRLEKFIDGSITPPSSHIAQRVDDELRSVENPKFITWRSQDQVLLGWLLSSMSEGIISLVFNLETSLEVWKAIEVQFGSQSKSRLFHLRGAKKNNMSGGRGFSGYGYNSGIGNGGYYKGNFGTDSAGAGTGFNTQFRGYQSGNQKGGGGGNWNNNNGVGNFNNGKPPMNSKPQWNTSKPTCQICLRPGHTVNICWKLEEFIISSAYRPPPNRGPKAAYLANMNAPADTNWYLDSTSKLVIGNGVGLCITHTGCAVLRMQSSVNKFELKLNNILLVPKITKNLISISKLTRDNDVVIEFTNDFCFVKDKGLLAHVESAVSTQPISMFFAVSSKFQNKTASQSHTEAQYSQNSDWYSLLHKGYKCLHSSGKVYIASHVLFDETYFPYSNDPTFLHSMPSKSSDFFYNSFQSFHISIPNSNQHPFEVAYAGTDSHTSSSTHNIIPLPFTTLPAATSNTTPAATSNTTPAATFNTTPVATSTITPAATSNITPAIISNITPLPTINQTSPDMPLSTYKSLSSPPQSIISTHPIITRAKAGIFKPKAFLTAHNSLEPFNGGKALSDSKWKAAMQDEFDALIRNKTWSLVPMDPEYKLVGCKWVFRTKYNTDGSVSKYKARLVAKEFHQTAGVDYSEIFSPVVKSSTVRVILSLAVMQGWNVRQIDVNNAFLNGDLIEDVFMQQPEGFVSEGGYVCKLNKALYGLKQAPRAWHDVKSIILILIYVDDILITGSDSDLLESFIAKLSKVFALKDLGLVTYFLGVEVCYTDNGMHLSQTKYIKDLLSKALMQNCKETDTPFSTGYKLERSAKGSLGAEFENATLYRSIVGGLQYLIPDQTLHIRALSAASSEISWLQSLFSELNITKLPTHVLWCDNQSAGDLARNPVFHSRSKHIELDVHYIRDKVLNKELEVRYIPTKEQVADVLTKPLSFPKFSYFRSKLNVFGRPLSLRGDVKEARMHRMVSEVEDCNTNCLQIQVNDMACQLEPGDFVISCTRED
ncbi:retrovirus-related pol polyprotein from transposon RE1 [Citrus sinensis]|nr:retrovirus-related pol polyprotein from transposon RE1 [Citrus sinensis]